MIIFHWDFQTTISMIFVSEAKIVQRKSKVMPMQSLMSSTPSFLIPIIKEVVKNEQSSLKHIKKYHII